MFLIDLNNILLETIFFKGIGLQFLYFINIQTECKEKLLLNLTLIRMFKIIFFILLIQLHIL